MSAHLFRVARLVVFLLAMGPSSLVWAATCKQIFAGGQPPALLNPKLAERTTVLCNNAFAVLASGITRGPLWSAEHLTALDLARARVTAREGRFHEDERLPPDDRAELSDYVRSGYDRGHMTPSGDMPNEVAQQQSFWLSNVVPQTAKLNRDAWEGIESAVRHLAERAGALYVVTGPAYRGADLQALKGRVLVPTATWKAVYNPVAQRAAAYLCSNIRRPNCTTLSITALARRVDLDPFPALPEAVKQTAMSLPAPEPSPYVSSRHLRHHYRKQHRFFDSLLP